MTDATLTLRHGDTQRECPLSAFYLGYMKNALQPGEFLQAIEVSLPQPGQVLRAYKISKRFDCDISALCGGFALTLDGDRVADVRLAFGGMAAVVRRAAGAEAALRSERWDEATLQRAQQALDADFTPLVMRLRAHNARVFGFGEIINNLGRPAENREVFTKDVKGLWPTKRDFQEAWPSVLRGIESAMCCGRRMHEHSAREQREKAWVLDPQRSFKKIYCIIYTF
jgi:hypothetical protein